MSDLTSNPPSYRSYHAKSVHADCCSLSCHRLDCDRHPSEVGSSLQPAGDTCLMNSARDCRLDHRKWWCLARAGVACLSSNAESLPSAFLAECPNGDRAHLHPVVPTCWTMNSMRTPHLSRQTCRRANPTVWAGSGAVPMRWLEADLGLTSSPSYLSCSSSSHLHPKHPPLVASVRLCTP